MKLQQFGSCDKVAYKTLIATTVIFIYCIPPRFLLSPFLLQTEFLADRFIFGNLRHLNVIFFYTELWTHKSATLTLIGISRKFADLIQTFQSSLAGFYYVYLNIKHRLLERKVAHTTRSSA